MAIDASNTYDPTEDMKRLEPAAQRLLNDFSIEKYVELRRQSQQLEITPGPFKNPDHLFEVAEELRSFQIDPQTLARVLDGDVVQVDDLCLKLLEQIIERKRLEGAGATHLQSRGKTTPDSLINFLIVMIMESCQIHCIYPTSSLVALVTEMLGGYNVERRQRSENEKKKDRAAFAAAFLSGESDREIAKQLDVDHSTLSRWRKDPFFETMVEAYSEQQRERCNVFQIKLPFEESMLASLFAHRNVKGEALDWNLTEEEMAFFPQTDQNIQLNEEKFLRLMNDEHFMETLNHFTDNFTPDLPIAEISWRFCEREEPLCEMEFSMSNE